MNKKGLYKELAITVILALVIGGFMILFWIYSMVAPVLSKTSGDVTSAINSAAVQTGDNNMTSAISTSTGIVTNTTPILKWIGYFALIFLFLGFIMIAFYVRTYPFLAFIWIGAIILLTVMAMILSNAYIQSYNTSDYLASAYGSFAANDYLMRYLPHIFAGFGILGGIVLFVLAGKEETTPTSI
jgi:glucan phosphoethanolaminetransferase (alkaline phosphatase superfamily)